MSRARRASILVAGLVGLGLGTGAVVPGPATALVPDRKGWWNAAYTAGVPVAPPAPPDVPADGLHVASGAGSPQAIAALAFTLPPDSTATVLTLSTAGVAPQAAGVLACAVLPASAGFAPAQNGRWEERPQYDCAGAATATVGADGKVTFPVASLARGGQLVIALVPGATDRVSFAPPGGDALQISTSPGTGVPAAPGSVSGDGSATPLPAAASAPLPLPAPVPTSASLVAGDPKGTASGAAPTGDARQDAAGQPAAVAGAGASSWRSRVGGALGFLILLTLLLSSAQARGLRSRLRR